MTWYTVTIVFTDGTTETVDNVTDVLASDGVLRLDQRQGYGGGTKHLGSFPLANIRKWTKEMA